MPLKDQQSLSMAVCVSVCICGFCIREPGFNICLSRALAGPEFADREAESHL